MRYLDWGGEGEPMLALHGLASSANWYDIVARLLRDRYRIIAPDQRGHGQTTQAGSGYDWHTLSDDLAALLDHVGGGDSGLQGAGCSPRPLLGRSRRQQPCLSLPGAAAAHRDDRRRIP